MGGDWIEKVNGGHEDHQLKKINIAIDEGRKIDEEELLAYSKKIAKDPRFFSPRVMSRWFKLRDDIKVLICRRETGNIAKALHRHKDFFIKSSSLSHEDLCIYLQKKVDECIGFLDRHNIEYESIWFPDYIDEPDDFFIKVDRLDSTLLPDKERAGRIWKMHFDRNLVHFR